MTIAKLETYQNVIEIIQSNLARNELVFATNETDKDQVDFVLAYMSMQNKNLIAALKTIEINTHISHYIERYKQISNEQYDFVSIMDLHIGLINMLNSIKAKEQNKLLKGLAMNIVSNGALITSSFTASFLGAPILAMYMIKSLVVLMIIVSFIVMGSALYNYMKGPGHLYPKLDANIVKNWDSDTAITRSSNGLNTTVAASSLKSQFSTLTLFGQSKTLATLVEENYRAKIRI